MYICLVTVGLLTVEFSEKGLTVSEGSGTVRVPVALQTKIAIPVTVDITFGGTAIHHQGTQFILPVRMHVVIMHLSYVYNCMQFNVCA